MEAWSVGVLEYWTGRSDGALERWTVGAVEYRPEEVNGPKGLGRIAQEPVGL
jgi:hypothetical protein